MEKELTQEEVAQRRQEITDFYETNIPHLKIQKEYEELLRDIELARAQRIEAQAFLAQALSRPEEEFEEAKDETKTRKLRR